MYVMISYKLDTLGAPSRQYFPPPSRQYKPHQGSTLNLPKAYLSLFAWECMLVTSIIEPVV